MARRVHWLKPNHATEIPSECIWFDTESRQIDKGRDGLEHRLTFGWAAYRRRRSNGAWTKPEWIRFDTAPEFYSFIGRKVRNRTKLYVFCLNTNFDLPLTDVFGNMTAEGFQLKRAVIDAPPTILTFRRPLQTVVFLDTLNFFRMSLAELGKHIGLDKMEMPDVETRSAEGDKYCRRDVDIIMKAMVQWFDFIKSNDLGGFASTLAGQAMRAYRHRFMPARILIDDKDKALALSRDAYYGGRVECFRVGYIKGPVSLVDFVSMFPSCMTGALFPTVLKAFWRRCSVAELSTAIKTHCVTARVRLRTDTPAYPTRHDDCLLFPVGEFVTCIATPEIEYALEHGHVLDVLEMAVYEKAEIFTDFVQYFHTLRQAAKASGDETTSWLYKILMNSLYGKFGQRGTVWEEGEQTDDLTAHSWVEIDAKSKTKTRMRRLGGLVQVQSGEAEAQDSHPAIAAHVTSYARMKLWRAIELAGRKNVYYVDTDSLLVNRAGFAALADIIEPERLGALGVEGVYPDAEIFGPKDYRFGTKERHKGVKKKARWIEPNVIEQEQWSSLRGLLRGGSVTAPTTQTIRKTLKREYKKGRVMPSGFVKPFRLDIEG